MFVIFITNNINIMIQRTKITTPISRLPNPRLFKKELFIFHFEFSCFLFKTFHLISFSLIIMSTEAINECLINVYPSDGNEASRHSQDDHARG